MKHFVRLLLLFGLLLLLASLAFADDPGLPPADDWLEQLWEARVIDETVSFSFTLTNCGETVLEQTAQGALDVSYTFEHTDWSHFSVRYDEEGQSGGTAYGFDPFGDHATLRARCFFYRENGDLFVCQCCEITTQDGILMHRACNTQETASDDKAICLCFESCSTKASPTEEFPQSSDDVGAPDTPVIATRCWTYFSSDNRPLWTVNLTGVFADAACIHANGTVSILDPTWACIESRFYPDHDCAVCVLTLRRTTLGIPTATRTYEFRLPPP